jgi:Adenylate and Guanylate cyclase catalytic domain
MSINFGLIHANFFFLDIVGLSDPSVSTRNQMRKIETLNKLVSECRTFHSVSKNDILVLPTGDGMAIGFTQGPQLPLSLAIELHKKIAKHNKGRIPSDSLRIRIGIHSGPVFIVKDLLNNRNIWGPGIIIARRVMDIGDDGHILMSARVAEDLRELSYEYKKIIRPLHDYQIKHGQSLLLYSAYGNGFGNAKPPASDTAQKSKMSREISILRKNTIYPFIGIKITVRDKKKMLVHYRRQYEIQNISDKPIHKVLHGLATDVEKNFNELNINAYDENNTSLKISSISVDKPYQKEFTTVFNKPIFKGEKGRYYVLEYDVEEPHAYFENTFFVSCKKFKVTFNFPVGIKNLAIYESNLETGENRRVKVKPVFSKDEKNRTIVNWTKTNIEEGQSFRFDWK